MKKSDLKSGMIIELRNGMKFIGVSFQNDIIFINNDDDFIFSKTISDDLTAEISSEWDIVKVYTPYSIIGVIQIKWDEAKLIWERQEPIEVTLEEVKRFYEENTGKKIKIAVDGDI